MLMRLSASDVSVLCRGFIALIVIVTLGVVVAEAQLNKLTQRQDFVEALNIRRQEALGAYSVYILGLGFQIKSFYPIAGISNTTHSFTVEVAGRRVTAPTVIYADLTETEYWLNLWRRQFAEEALGTRQRLEKLMLSLRPAIRDFVKTIKQ